MSQGLAIGPLNPYRPQLSQTYDRPCTCVYQGGRYVVSRRERYDEGRRGVDRDGYDVTHCP